MALVYSASEKMNREYRDAVIAVSDKVNLALRDGIYATKQDAIESEIDEFMSRYEDAAVVYGYLLGTMQCFTAGEAIREFFNDIQWILTAFDL